MSLQKKAKNGLIWTFIDSIFLRGLSFIAQLILARWLGPDVFALMGLIIVFNALGNTILDSGLSASIIRTIDPDNEDYSTIFFTNIIFSIFLYFVFYISAPFIANFYSQELLTNIIRVYSLGFIISGFSIIQIAILNKNLQFKKIAIFNSFGNFLGITIGLLLGYYSFGVWSLIYMYLATQFINTIIYWLFSDWKPQLLFSVKKFYYHFQFGYKLLLSGIINVLFGNIYMLLIGKYFSLKQLGYFERAYTYNQYPISVISNVVAKVSFPLMVQAQSNDTDLKIMYKKIMILTFLVVAPAMLIIANTAETIFLVLLGVNWMPIVPIFKLICLASILFPLQLFNINILKVKGKSNIFLRIEIIKKIVSVTIVLLIVEHGFYYILYALIINSFLEFCINSYFCGREINYNTFEQLKDIFLIFLYTILAILIYNYFITLFPIENNFFLILISILIPSSIFLLLTYFFNRKVFNLAYSIIKFT